MISIWRGGNMIFEITRKFVDKNIEKLAKFLFLYSFVFFIASKFG